MNDQIKTEQTNEAHISPSVLNDGLGVIDADLDIAFREMWHKPALRAFEYIGAIGFGLKHKQLNPLGRYPALWTRLAVGRRVLRIKLCWVAFRSVPRACFSRLLGKIGVFCIQQVIKSISGAECVTFQFFQSGCVNQFLVTSNVKVRDCANSGAVPLDRKVGGDSHD